jgi:hypothetical protein
MRHRVPVVPSNDVPTWTLIGKPSETDVVAIVNRMLIYIQESVRKTEMIKQFEGCPSISLFEYTNRIVRYTHADFEDLCICLCYLNRIPRMYPNFAITRTNIHRVFLAAFLLGMKMYWDCPLTNRFCAKIGGIDEQEMNNIEIAMLELFDYNAFISIAEFQAMKRCIVRSSYLFQQRHIDAARLSIATSVAQ